MFKQTAIINTSCSKLTEHQNKKNMDSKLFFALIVVSTLIVLISAKPAPAENTLDQQNGDNENLQIDTEQNVSL